MQDFSDSNVCLHSSVPMLRQTVAWGQNPIDQAISPDTADCEVEPGLGLAVIKLAEFGRTDKCVANTTVAKRTKSWDLRSSHY